MPSKPLLIVITGPTASGKTELAISIAQHFNTEILSADSRQVYKEISIGTAKPTADELSQAKHHFINHISIHQNYDVGIYQQEALNVLGKIFQQKKVAVMVGGTGLYIKSVTEGLDEFPEIDAATRNFVRQNYQQKGIEWLQNELKSKDEIYFNHVDKNNPHRLTRALEVCLAAGKPFSSFLHQQKKELLFTVLKIAIAINREKLYERINLRVEKMMQLGLEEESRNVYPFKHLQALQTVGYKELFDYFDNKISKEKAIELIQQNTRNYAKRQLTWLKKDATIHWLQPNADEIIEFIKTKLP